METGSAAGIFSNTKLTQLHTDHNVTALCKELISATQLNSSAGDAVTVSETQAVIALRSFCVAIY